MSETVMKAEEASSVARFQQDQIATWDEEARQLDKRVAWGGYYQRRLAEVYRFLIGSDQRVLELGCGRGDLIAAIAPENGVGVDFSEEMIRRASARHPKLRFIHADAHELEMDETFDVIILSDLVNELWDVQQVFRRVARLSHPRTRVILNLFSRLWHLPLGLAGKLGLTKRKLSPNWLMVEDVENLLYLADFEVVRRGTEVLWPLGTPVVSGFFNRFLAKLWPFRLAALTNVLVARPRPKPRAEEPRVSVVIPARNEAGNIASLFERTPEMGSGTELIFVEGHSKDDTYAAIERAIAENPKRLSKLLRQTGKGKGDAVRAGFAAATGDVLMILDADATMPPEDLPRFYDALLSGKGEFINGVRLVYPMEKQAMRFFNLIGNKFFSTAFSWLLGQSLKDTLCGTKVLWKSDYELLAKNRAYFGDFDPFGDFDLIFGAAKLNLKIVDMPIHYRERTYGETNIQRWRHGVLLLRMVMFAARRIRFV